MQEKSSANSNPALTMTRGRRIAMVAIGLTPLLHFSGVIAIFAWHLSQGLPGTGAALAVGALYLAPPILCRLGLILAPIRQGKSSLEEASFLAWWLSAQWQVVFNRLPFLEEILRMVPGLYSLWLRLWGSRVGSLVYWSPGCVLLDRSMLRVGHRVVFGAGARVNPHVIGPDEENRISLHAANITIGNDALVGGYTLLMAGCRVENGEVIPALTPMPPFSTWKESRRWSLRKMARSVEA